MTLGPSQTSALIGLTRRYAMHATNLTFEDLPAEVVAKAKLLIRDGVGNQIAASATSEPASRVVGLVQEWGGKPQCTIVGHGIRVPAPLAALCNAMQGHGVELDDAHGTGLLKGGSVMIPAALAAAELSGASGKQVIAALVAGYDIAVRIAKAINPGHRRRGYHATGTVSTFGAAAVCAKLLGGDSEVIANALGLAGMQAAGIQSFLNDPCLAKPFSPGKSAFNGVLAGILASRGFTGPKTVLECDEGFLNAYADQVDAEILLQGLGQEYAVMEVGFKPHAACRYAHGPIDLAQSFYRDAKITLDMVRTVEVEMSELAIRQASKPKCDNLNVAMGSTEFGVVLALSRGGNGLRDYWDGYKDQEVHKRLPDVRLSGNPDFGYSGRASAVTVRLKDGRTMRKISDQPRGEPQNPLSPPELERKFLAMTTLVLEEHLAQELSDQLINLERISNAGEVLAAAVVPGGEPKLRAA